MSNVFYTSWNIIYNYFINSHININNEDDYKTKVTKYLLKYKRIIGLVLLIILFIIGYYEYYEYNEYNDENYKNYSNLKQQGGSSAAASILSVKRKLSFTDANQAGKQAKDSKAILKEAKNVKRADKIHAKVGSIMSKGTGFRMKEGTKRAAIAKLTTGAISKSVTGTVSTAYNVGAAGAETIRDNADWFYGMIYAVAISLAVCIITIPSIAFFIVGIICFVLLKSKMKYFKGL